MTFNEATIEEETKIDAPQMLKTKDRNKKKKKYIFDTGVAGNDGLGQSYKQFVLGAKKVKNNGKDKYEN